MRAFQATVTYILIYGIMNLGAFAVTTAVSSRQPLLQIEDFAGLAQDGAAAGRRR